MTVGAAVYVYWSALLVALVPPGVVTVTSAVPAVPAGARTVHEVAVQETPLAVTSIPKVTAVVPDSPVPVIVTGVPADSGPADGLTDVTTGAAT